MDKMWQICCVFGIGMDMRTVRWENGIGKIWVIGEGEKVVKGMPMVNGALNV
jgi:hypothetical protein